MVKKTTAASSSQAPPKINVLDTRQIMRLKDNHLKYHHGYAEDFDMNKVDERILQIDAHKIKNKYHKHEIVTKQRKLKRILQNKGRLARRAAGVPVQQPITQEDKRQYDPSIITTYKTNYHPENDKSYLSNFNKEVHELKVESLKEEENLDEFEEYFQSDKPAKVLITLGYNEMLDKVRKPTQKFMTFIKELLETIPNSFYIRRKSYYIKEVVDYALQNEYTDLIVINERNNKPDRMVLIHLPKGPTAIFRLSFPKTKKEIHLKKAKVDREYSQKYYPELILNNFTTRLGYRIARMFQAIFPQRPNFTGRRVVTLHNQRDFIFFRHHVYDFYNVTDENKGNDHDEYDIDDVYLKKNLKKQIESLNKQLKSVNNELEFDKGDTKGVKIQEVGPRVTFRLISLQLGLLDNISGEFEWFKKGGITSKKQFIL
ncbi:hypothetical protein ABK040_010695 [Willaertia magna]